MDCSTKAIDCPRGVCDVAMCAGGDACAFTPDNVAVPANAVKYNIGSSTWPFCGDNNWLSVVVDMQADGGGADDGSACTAPDCDATECIVVEEAAIEACGAVHGMGQAACEAVSGCTYTGGAAPPADCTTMPVDTADRYSKNSRCFTENNG